MSFRFLLYLMKNVVKNKNIANNLELLLNNFHNDPKFEYKSVDSKNRTHVLTRFDNRIEKQIYYPNGTRKRIGIDYYKAISLLKEMFIQNHKEKVLEEYNSQFFGTNNG